MPAEIDGTKAVYAKDPAWHRIGTVFDNVFTADQALSILDPDNEPIRQVLAQAVFVGPDGNPVTVEAEDQEAVVGWDHETQSWRILSFQSKQYGVVQLRDQFRFMDEVVSNVDGAHYEAAVRMRKGRQVCLTINLGELVLDPKGIADKQVRYLWGFNSYDSSWALRLKFGNFRVECANMAAMALRGSSDKQVIGSDWSTRHTTNVMQRVEEAKSVLGFWSVYEAEYATQAEHMIQTQIHDNAFGRIIEGLYTAVNPKTDQEETDKEAVEQVRVIYELDKSQADLYGTVWGALQATIRHHDWATKVRGGKTTNVNEQRFLRQIEDPTGLKQSSWDAFSAYAQEAKKVKVPVGAKK